MLLRDVDFVLDNIFVTVGDDVWRQILGVPMGFSCSPMLAVLMLAFYEVRFLRRLVADAAAADGALVSTPWGQLVLDGARRCRASSRTAPRGTCCFGVQGD